MRDYVRQVTSAWIATRFVVSGYARAHRQEQGTEHSHPAIRSRPGARRKRIERCRPMTCWSGPTSSHRRDPLDRCDDHRRQAASRHYWPELIGPSGSARPDNVGTSADRRANLQSSRTRSSGRLKQGLLPSGQRGGCGSAVYRTARHRRGGDPSAAQTYSRKVHQPSGFRPPTHLAEISCIDGTIAGCAFVPRVLVASQCTRQDGILVGDEATGSTRSCCRPWYIPPSQHSLKISDPRRAYNRRMRGVHARTNISVYLSNCLLPGLLRDVPVRDRVCTLGNLVVTKSIDSGPARASSRSRCSSISILLAAFFRRAAQRRADGSGRQFKRAWTRIVPEPAERSTYVLFSEPGPHRVVLAVAAVGRRHPRDINIPWGEHSSRHYSGGWLLLLVSTFLIDHFDSGLRQVLVHLHGRTSEPLSFRTPGL